MASTFKDGSVDGDNKLKVLGQGKYKTWMVKKFTGQVTGRDKIYQEMDRITSIPALISEKGYLPCQIFNAGEKRFSWKQMNGYSPAHGSRDKLTLLLCTNASGDCFMKPMIIYKEKNPLPLRGKNKNYLPIFWRSSRGAAMTEALFRDWFQDCFLPEIEVYLLTRNYPFKVLLIVDGSPGHPADLNLAHPQVEVAFLPPDITQPLDRGVFAAFETNYARRASFLVAEAMNRNSGLTRRQSWKNFNIADCLWIVGDSVDEIESGTIQASWENILSPVLKDESTTDDTNEAKEPIEVEEETAGISQFLLALADFRRGMTRS